MRSLSIIVFLLSSIALSDDYYQMLGVSRDADEKTIKKAFKKISLEKHPDRDGGNNQDRYMRLSNAYEALSNPMKREIYDRYGEDGLTKGMNYNLEDITSCYHGQKNPMYFYHQIRFFEDTPVIRVDGNNDKNLQRRSEIWLVYFYGPRCRDCQNFKGEWIELAHRVSDFVKIAAVDCDQNEGLCTEYNVKRYPVIYYFPDNTLLDPEIYKGERNVNKLAEFALSKVQGYLRFVNSNNIDEFLQTDPEKVKILTFTNTKEVPVVIKAISREFRDKVVFGEARSSDAGLVSKYGASGFPCLYLVTPKSFERFSQHFARTDIEKWIYKHIDQHQVVVFSKELTRTMYLAGNCNPTDSRFCLLAFNPDAELKDLLNEISFEFKDDPVQVFWVNANKFESFANVFGEKAIIYRAKKQKFAVVQCDKEYQCYKEAVVNALNGALTFRSVKGNIEYVEKKAEL